jgi:hypothetical protein
MYYDKKVGSDLGSLAGSKSLPCTSLNVELGYSELVAFGVYRTVAF